MLVAACKTDPRTGRQTTSKETSMKMSFILPVMASVALVVPAFAQTSPPPATQEPAMQDQSTSAPAAKHMKAKTKGAQEDGQGQARKGEACGTD
jgi:hypothetical protein